MRSLARLKICLAAACVLVLGTSSSAEEQYLLRIVNSKQSEHPVRLTDADLLALPQISFTTSTPWTETALTFSGPTLSSVLQYYNITDGQLNLVAVNRYEIEVPWDYVEKSSPIIANRINGEAFTVREKGPLWVVFPFDSDERYTSFLVHSMSVWQLIKIEIS